MLTNERHQHAVGHGFFHTASMRVRKGVPFDFVYDCGARKSKILLAPAIRAYSDSLGTRSVNLVVLSHFHADHVNGLDVLLANKHVDTVIMPYVSPAERLLLVAQLVAVPTTTVSDINLAIAPKEWLRDRGVKRIVEIQASADPPPDQPPPTGVSTPGSGWELRVGSATGPVLPDKAVIGHKTPICLTHDAIAVWEFLFFCWNSDELVAKVADAFNSQLGITPDVVERPQELLELLQDATKRRLIVKCYKDICSGDLNWTTLCMWSGPKPPRQPFNFYADYVVRKGGIEVPLVSRFRDESLGWLGTGDLELAQPKVAEPFYKHYAARSVASLSLPHHGSIENFDADLLTHFDPALVFATCPPDSAHHPNQAVVDAIAPSGVIFVKVEESAASQLHETVRSEWYE